MNSTPSILGAAVCRKDAALLYDAVATAELDAARTPPSTDAEECDDDDAALLMALKAAPCAS